MALYTISVCLWIVTTLARFCSFGANPYMLYWRCSKAYKTESCCEQTPVLGVCFLHRKRKGGASLNTSNNLPQLPPPRKSPGRWLYAAWLGVSILPLLIQPASATTIWEKATEIMKDVYQQILLISTIAAIVTASVALLMMNFSRSGRTVEESRAWLKRIAITWAILNGLGFIMAYVTPFFSGGQWTA